jgi:hypothetical protein
MYITSHIRSLDVSENGGVAPRGMAISTGKNDDAPSTVPPALSVPALTSTPPGID